MNPGEPPVFRNGGRLVWGGAAAFVVGAALVVAGALSDRRQALFSYLVAHAFLLTIALGALVFLMTGHAMGAKWPVAVRRITETLAATLPLLGLLFVPVLLGLEDLYPWMRPERLPPEARHLVEHKRPWLNAPSFVARAAIYFALWTGLSVALRRMSLAADFDPGKERARVMQAVSAVGLPLVGLTWTFASFDWMMSLTPAWSSTMYGVYVFAGGFVAALSLLTILAHAARGAGLLPGVGPSHYHALGRLLLAFTVFWAYAAFFQFFLVWIANRPEEAAWYVVRVRGGWRGATLVVAVLHFAVPFSVLLSYRVKRHGAAVSAVAAVLVAAHLADVHWLVAPALHSHGFRPSWLDPAALVALSGAFTAFAAWMLRSRCMVPRNDPALAAAVAYRSS